MSSKVKGLLCYLLGWIPCLIVMFGIDDNTRDDYFNAAQALVLHVLYFICNLVMIFIFFINPFTGIFTYFALYIFYLVLIIIGCIKTCKEEDSKLIIVGDLTENIFKNKLDSFNLSNSINNNVNYNYDPNTGERINNKNWNYDPNTGERIK